MKAAAMMLEPSVIDVLKEMKASGTEITEADGNAAYLLSIAISAKRIADALEPETVVVRGEARPLAEFAGGQEA